MNRHPQNQRRRRTANAIAAAATGLLVTVLIGDGRAQEQAPATAATTATAAADTTVIAVDSPAFTFSPGNWSGDAGRAGSGFRQTWNPGAYFRVTWESGPEGNGEAAPPPTLLLDTSTHGPPFDPPRLAYSLDGIWQGDVACAEEVPLEGARSSGTHELTVFLKSSRQTHRWGSEGESGRNVLRVKGLRIGSAGKPVPATPGTRWALIVGDSITEGVGAYELECYSHLVGEALLTRGYEYGISACGWSGWLNRGDNPPGDVPGYYVVRDSVDGRGGRYVAEESRWHRIDANHSLLDADGRLSAHGGTGQEPSVILINYGTNDSLHRQNPSDVRASMRQCLPALREAAPEAHLFVLIPFGQFQAAELREAVAEFRASRPDDRRLTVIDLGPDAARALSVKSGYWGGLHPNPRAHATFAAKIIPQILEALD